MSELTFTKVMSGKSYLHLGFSATSTVWLLCSMQTEYEFYFARVNRYSKHPDRYEFGFPLEIWCNTFDLFGPACFIPVQRISSHCISGEIIHEREKVLAVTS